MKLISVTFILIFFLNSLAVAQELSSVKSFAFALGLELSTENIEKLTEYDLIVVDGTDTEREQIATMRSKGGIVLGYVSAGTIEKGRLWFKKLKSRGFALSYWEEWDEWYAAVNKRTFRRFFIRKIAKQALKKGFDGLFLDNTDMISLYPRQTRGMRKLLKSTRKLLGRERLLFLQNGDDIFYRLEKAVHIDGWNREDVTSTYNFETERYEMQSDIEIDATLYFIRSLLGKGYFVTTADYTDESAQSVVEQSIINSCSAGAIPFVGDVFLTRLPAAPVICD